MTGKLLRITYCVILFVGVGCSSLAPFLSQPTPVSIPHTTSTPQLIPLATQTSSLPKSQAHILRLWLPPRFDPNAGTVSANLIKRRLAEFETLHPGLKIEVRIKAEQGETGLLNSLAITSNAAPSVLPDLVPLLRPDLEAAVAKGLVHPMDGLSAVLHDPNWYPYARELGHVQNIGYGLPFAGDLLVMLHHPDLKTDTWNDVLSNKSQLLFPAKDPQALVMLTLYVSAGGKLVTDQGAPTLEEQPLTQVLTLAQKAVDAKVFSPVLLNYETDAQALQAYHNGFGSTVITWTPDDEIVYPITDLGTPITFANGWVWALAGSIPENQQVAVELAEFLLDDSFLAEWISGMNYLPTRLYQSSHTDPILESAQALPPEDVLAVLGPIMNQALSRILNGDQVEAVVRSVLEQVK